MTGSTPAFTHDREGTSEQDWQRALAAAHPPPRHSTYEELLAHTDAVILLAAHPDDEVLGAAGLVQAAHRSGISTHVIIATDGEASHPHSPTHSAQELARRRRAEATEALAVLATPGQGPQWLGLPDSALAEHIEAVATAIVQIVGRSQDRSLIVAPWRADGHADHEAAGTAASAAAYRTGARLLEYPIWWWHWSDPQKTDWQRLVAVPLSEGDLARKQDAIACHRSQVQALSDQPGDERLLSREFLAHLLRDQEFYLTEQPHDDALDRLHRAKEDPWRVHDSWYEQRKRAVTMSALPRARYRRGLEVGCSVGRLTQDLADRCDQVLALDASPAAVELARATTAGLPGVSVRTATVPEDWPDASFDLIVLSEVGYFLSPARWEEVLRRATEAMTDDGHLLLCHWRHPVVGWPLDGDAVHALAGPARGLVSVVQHEEADFLLEVFARRQRE